jgi:hypothetical protein
MPPRSSGASPALDGPSAPQPTLAGADQTGHDAESSGDAPQKGGSDQIQSLQAIICELLIQNERLRMRLAEKT